MEADVIILGAGGAGMMCAIEAGKRGRQVVLLDHAQKVGGKILISGGGRCNFTNIGASPAQYVSENPHFAKSALSRFEPVSFIEMVKKHGIPFYEKKLGQLFCERSAQDIVEMLRKETLEAGATFKLGTEIKSVSRAVEGDQAKFKVETNQGEFTSTSLVIATGGLSLPKVGATGIGYDIAKQFGHTVTKLAPALDGFNLEGTAYAELRSLSGIAVDCKIECNGKVFRENILFTHTGLSGPASLQASLHWYEGDPLTINLLPDLDAFAWLLKKKREGGRTSIRNILAEVMPRRLVDVLCDAHFKDDRPLPQIAEKALEAFAKHLNGLVVIPKCTVGYSKAEVTRGGVNTDELSSKTLESKKTPKLFFIGEVVDVTGWLGGYNFQWAWASGWAAGQEV